MIESSKENQPNNINFQSLDDSVIQKIVKEKSNDSWWLDSEKKVVGRYGKIFHPKNLEQLTKEDFKSFLLLKNNLHWDGIHRQNNLITQDMNSLKKSLKFLLDEKVEIKERLNIMVDQKSSYSVKGLGKAVLTPILLVVYPTKYGVWNSRSEEALKKINSFPKFLPKDTFADRYVKVNDALHGLVNKYNLSLWKLDGVLGEIAGTSPFESPTDLLEEEAEEKGLDLTNFAMESQLEDFLIANWEKTIFGKKYYLIYEEGEIVSKQYPTKVGPIDILAKSKDDNEYLVIELKKGKPSDAVVGQLLRYKSWVKENLAKDKKVRGVVVVLDSDDKLKYSLRDLKDVSLYIYQVNFKLIEQRI